MKKLIIILVVLFAGRIFGQTGFSGSNFTSANPSFSYVGTTQGSCYAGAVSTCATSSTFNAVKGNTLVVFVVTGTVTTCPQASDFITDSAGNTFSSTLVCTASSNRGVAQIYIGTVTNGSATDTVTAHFGSNKNFVDLFVRQYSGVTISGQQYDRHFAASGSSISPINTLRKYEILLQCSMGDTVGSNSVYSVGTIAGSTAQNFVNNSPYGFTWSGCQDQFVSTIQSSASASMTVSGGTQHNTLILTLSAWPIQPAPLASAPLSFTTYDGSGQVVHPSIVYIPSGWNGFTYWLAAEPYPAGNSALENPSVWASNDGTSWSVPVGLTNPVSGTVSAPQYYNDGELFYDLASNEMWLYYVLADPSVPSETLLRRTSSNGTTWSSATTIIASLPNYQLISPSIQKVGSTYYMWAVNTGVNGCTNSTTSVDMRTSSDGVTWGSATTTNLKLQGSSIPWHMNVTYIASRDEFVSLIVGKTTSTCAPTTGIFLGRSHDGITWITYPFTIMNTINSVAWDSGELYRSTTLYDEATDLFRVWYSATNNNGGGGTWGIGFLSAPYTTTAQTAATTDK